MATIFQFIIASFLLNPIFAYADDSAKNFFYVEQMICDGEEITVPEGQSIFFNSEESTFFGIGKFERNEEKTCNVIDFYSVLTTAFEYKNTALKATFLPVEKIGRRSSCEEGILQHQGPDFTEAIFTSDETGTNIVLKGLKDCQLLEYKLSVQNE